MKKFVRILTIVTNFFIIAGNTKNLWFGHKDTKCSVMSINKDTVPPNKVV